MHTVLEKSGDAVCGLSYTIFHGIAVSLAVFKINNVDLLGHCNSVEKDVALNT